jgi:hypothetical protein
VSAAVPLSGPLPRGGRALALLRATGPAGTLLAVTAAWRRGASDAVISSGLDILFAFPGTLLAVLAAAVFGADLTAAAIALSTPVPARTSCAASFRRHPVPETHGAPVLEAIGLRQSQLTIR